MKQYLETILTLACIAIAGYLLVTLTPVVPAIKTALKSETAAAAPAVDSPPPQVIFQTPNLKVYPTITMPTQYLPATVIPYKECTTAQWKAGEVGCNFIVDAVDVVNTPGPTPLPLGLPERICTRAEWEELAQRNFPNPSGCTQVQG